VRKIIIGAQVSMDGVMQAPGGPTEDPTNGFKSGGWVAPYRHPASGDELNHLFEENFDLLLGRKTYEIGSLPGVPPRLFRSIARRSPVVRPRS
jgi:dihydrofolate reductase